MAQEFALATPTTEELTRVGIVGASAGVTGAVEGVVIAMAPKLGALEVPFTWLTMLGVPAIGAAAALMTKGMISDAGLGMAAGGLAILGQTLPAMFEEFTGGRTRRGTGSQGQLGAASGVKQLSAGPLGAPQRAQQNLASIASQLDI